MIKERPILFTAEMAQACYEGRKTQTRRAIKSPYSLDGPFHWVVTPEGFAGCLDLSGDGYDADGEQQVFQCPFGVPGDRLWVQEEFNLWMHELTYRGEKPWVHGTWNPAKSMQRPHARTILEITDVRVERLRDISEGDAQKEGAICAYKGSEPQSYIDAFHAIWNCLYPNGKFGWDANPWVWVIGFRKVDA